MFFTEQRYINIIKEQWLTDECKGALHYRLSPGYQLDHPQATDMGTPNPDSQSPDLVALVCIVTEI